VRICYGYCLNKEVVFGVVFREFLHGRVKWMIILILWASPRCPSCTPTFLFWSYKPGSNIQTYRRTYNVQCVIRSRIVGGSRNEWTEYARVDGPCMVAVCRRRLRVSIHGGHNCVTPVLNVCRVTLLPVADGFR